MINIGFFSTKKYDRLYFDESNQSHRFKLTYFESPLDENTASLASQFETICVFVNDRLNSKVLKLLRKGKTRIIALRCAGYNNVDLAEANSLGFRCVRVPAYSPNAVAEHVIALLLTLYRSTHKAYSRVRDGNFALDGLVGEEIFGKTVGIIGTGKIGSLVANIFASFGCIVLAHDPTPNEELAAKNIVQYVDFPDLCRESDIISLNCPLTTDNKHMINQNSIDIMKPGVTLINTGRGALLDTHAVYQALKAKKVGFLAIDVYEEEANLFFEDLSTDIILDDLFMRLTTFPNVLITGHQGFFTDPALSQIANVTLNNIQDIISNNHCDNELVDS